MARVNPLCWHLGDLSPDLPCRGMGIHTGCMTAAWVGNVAVAGIVRRISWKIEVHLTPEAKK